MNVLVQSFKIGLTIIGMPSNDHEPLQIFKMRLYRRRLECLCKKPYLRHGHIDHKNMIDILYEVHICGL